MKLANRIIEAIDLDGYRPNAAKAYVRSKRILDMVLDRLENRSKGMLKSLELMTKEDRKSSQGTLAIKATKSILQDTIKLKRQISDRNGLRSLVHGSENKKSMALLKRIADAADFIEQARDFELQDSTDKQLESYLKSIKSEFTLIRDKVIKDLL